MSTRFHSKHVVGIAVLACALSTGVWGVISYQSGDHLAQAKAAETGPLDKARQVAVVACAILHRDFEETLTVQGNVEAKNFAMVSARMPGTIERLFVTEGDAVEAGVTELFQIDALKIRKAVEIRCQDLAIARCARLEKDANLERTEAVLEKAQIDFKRLKHLLEKGLVGTLDGVERSESGYKQALAVVKHAKSLVALSAEQEHQAKAALVIAEKDMSDTLVQAPISGRISQRLQELGEMAEPGRPVFRIDDTTTLEISAFLPSQYYARVEPGKTTARINVEGIDTGELVVTYRSPIIHPKLRTFEVKCLVTSPPKGVAPGALANLGVILARASGLGVPATAIQRREGRKVVFVVHEDRSRLVAISEGTLSGGWVLVKALDPSDTLLKKGALVITDGQYLVDEGTPVLVREDEAPAEEDAQ